MVEFSWQAQTGAERRGRAMRREVRRMRCRYITARPSFVGRSEFQELGRLRHTDVGEPWSTPTALPTAHARQRQSPVRASCNDALTGQTPALAETASVTGAPAAQRRDHPLNTSWNRRRPRPRRRRWRRCGRRAGTLIHRRRWRRTRQRRGSRVLADQRGRRHRGGADRAGGTDERTAAASRDGRGTGRLSTRGAGVADADSAPVPRESDPASNPRSVSGWRALLRVRRPAGAFRRQSGSPEPDARQRTRHEAGRSRDRPLLHPVAIRNRRRGAAPGAAVAGAARRPQVTGGRSMARL